MNKLRWMFFGFLFIVLSSVQTDIKKGIIGEWHVISADISPLMEGMSKEELESEMEELLLLKEDLMTIQMTFRNDGTMKFIATIDEEYMEEEVKWKLSNDAKELNIDDYGDEDEKITIESFSSRKMVLGFHTYGDVFYLTMAKQ